MVDKTSSLNNNINFFIIIEKRQIILKLKNNKNNTRCNNVSEKKPRNNIIGCKTTSNTIPNISGAIKKVTYSIPTIHIPRKIICRTKSNLHQRTKDQESLSKANEKV